jgi:hypothetical protein
MKFFLVVYKSDKPDKPVAWHVVRTISKETAMKDIVFHDSTITVAESWHVIACIPVVSIVEECERT